MAQDSLTSDVNDHVNTCRDDQYKVCRPMITILRKNRVHNEGCGYDDEWCKHHEDASDDTAEDRHPWLYEKEE